MGLAVKKVLCRIVFGGHGARGSDATSKKPAGVSAREKANQSNLHFEQPLSWPSFGTRRYVPGGNGAAGKRATWTKPRRGRSAGALRSIEPSRCTTL